MRTSGIYKIQSIRKPERVYIGSAMNLYLRLKGHQSLLRRGIHHSLKLQAHCNKYGINDLIFDTILECPKEQLVTREQDFIDALNPWFNVRIIATSNAGFKHSQKTKDKIRAKKKGCETWNKGKALGFTPKKAFKKGQVPWNKGKHYAMPKMIGNKNGAGKRSEETKNNMKKL
jgi:group I intron endonuclease